MDVRTTSLDGMLLLSRKAHEDARGTFDVIWGSDELAEAGIDAVFVQDNLIKTRRGTLRGMHFQSRRPQGKLLTVLEGEVFDAAVDLRPDSPTFGRAEGLVLRADDCTSLWLPAGFAHGFLALSERVTYLYKVTAPWDPEQAHVLAWDDPHVGIKWPLAAGEAPVLSARDRAGLAWAEVREMLR
ncbi:MAG: dTDP-4-dehydrorhamnose 3,5-epimerase [Chthoniobacterales bacterium]